MYCVDKAELFQLGAVYKTVSHKVDRIDEEKLTEEGY